MDSNVKKITGTKINNVIRALEANNMTGIYAPDCAAAIEEVRKLLHDGDTISMGGTVTAKESGVAELIRTMPIILTAWTAIMWILRTRM